MENYHIPVLRNESIEALQIQPNGIYVDLTFGGGGHAGAILDRLGKEGVLIAFDQDKDAINNIPDDPRLLFIPCNFKYTRGALRSYGITQVDGILADLGVSSHHFDDKERGFSFRFDSQLDMRMNPLSEFSAVDIVAKYDHKQLLSIFRDYGELSQPHKIAACIERARAIEPILTTAQLIKAVEPLTPKKDSAKFLAQLFQAFRIEVNHEMDALKMMLEQSAKVLSPGGRLAIITYHSLEDRLVKNFIKSGNTEGYLEKDLYGNCSTPLTAVSKLIVPSQEEIAGNSRSRSAKLRVAEKL